MKGIKNCYYKKEKEVTQQVIPTFGEGGEGEKKKGGM